MNEGNNRATSAEYYYYLGGHFWDERVPVIDDGVLVFPVPEVELDAAATAQQGLAIDFNRRLAGKLVSYSAKRRLKSWTEMRSDRSVPVR